MRILVADDDPMFRSLLGRTVQARRSHEVVFAENGSQALDLALSAPRPDVLILDWQMPNMTGAQVCRIVRGSRLDPQPYIFLVTGRARREELIECLSCGGDDLLMKPIAPDVFIAKLELVFSRAHLAPDGSQRVHDALHNAKAEGSGELLIRSENFSGRVLYRLGKIAWVHTSDGSSSIFEALSPGGGIDVQTARTIVAECRATGSSITDVLIAWGLVDQARLREAMRVWLQNMIEVLTRLPNPSFLFLPATYAKGPEELLFDVDEVLAPLSLPKGNSLSDTEKRPTLIPRGGLAAAFVFSDEQHPEVMRLLERCMMGDGVLGAAVIELHSGMCLGWRGQELDPDVVWAQLQTLKAVMRSGTVQDSVIVTDQHLHLAMLAESPSAILVCLVVDTERARQATARYQLRRAISEQNAAG